MDQSAGRIPSTSISALSRTPTWRSASTLRIGVSDFLILSRLLPIGFFDDAHHEPQFELPVRGTPLSLIPLVKSTPDRPLSIEQFRPSLAPKTISALKGGPSDRGFPFYPTLLIHSFTQNSFVKHCLLIAYSILITNRFFSTRILSKLSQHSEQLNYHS
ncbi:hypothetical protein Cob_v001149 [Colletotrichum orbiculare MAFF 240422]|uniref:Uncharacterized protein n=1 Tax=Colletotrichum orbiculare (strain 104-T / ATCC 96160 / CBS 514.97 / LARS 414 / MAFF 240422) TaxID=1213857 RepID=A0A484GA22_COLOR|nr:hypothetical protein Cob_v001149 [Colletotrichum orbiculare MAFF 240422]